MVVLIERVEVSELLIGKREEIKASSTWSDGGLTPEDMAAWLQPGFPSELDCEVFEAIEFKPPRSF